MIRDFGIDALIPIGGEGTLTAAHMLSDAGLPVVGVPKTIDNDISSTDRTFGFDTAVGVATEAMDRLKTTAESHQRVMVVEVMGRHAGWIALESGMAAGAHGICLPERPFDPAQLVKMVEERFSPRQEVRGRSASPRAHTRPTAPWTTARARSTSSVTSASRASARPLAHELERRLGKEAKPVILGHVQRGGVPTAYDRVLATRFGWHAVEAAHRGEFGKMTALRGTDIVMVPLAEAVGR
ncbi:ATP-dependent 6-phosphofructokinase OS=Streptomyces griseomycini OX=66895 GN=pfkA PE=3 SV=1 [Streptomyces griseomycini]